MLSQVLLKATDGTADPAGVSPPTALDREQHVFTRRGVAVIDGAPAGVDPVPLYARVVRNGVSTPLDHHDGDPSTLRVTANTTALFVLVLFLGLGAMALGPMLAGYRPVVVGSGSMEPSLQVADVVVVKNAQTADIAIGTVVDAITPEGGRIHRVVEVLPEGYRTQGDANGTPDSDLVPADRITGVGVFLVPFVGHPRVWFDHGDWWQLGTLIVVFLAAANCSRAVWLRSGSLKASERFPDQPGRVR